MNIEVLISTLENLRTEKTWTKEKIALHANLIEQTAADQFFRFAGRAELFNLKRLPHIGEACLYEVPQNKRGKLSIFQGKEVIAICIGNKDANNRNIAIIESSHAFKLKEYIKSLQEYS